MRKPVHAALQVLRKPRVIPHVGAIHSSVAGRTDHLPMHVPAGAYVVPADIVSGMGEGNTSAGFHVAKSIFSAPNRTGGTPYGESGLPYGADTPHRASGGEVDEEGMPPVGIVAAGGEYVIPPEDVTHIGSGNLDDGHKVLDHFVVKYRKRLVDTLNNLPGPKRS